MLRYPYIVDSSSTGKGKRVLVSPSQVPGKRRGSDRTFIPADFVVPRLFITETFRLEPLGPGHNEMDFEAWTSSLNHIRATPGFHGRRWPRGGMTLDENLADLEKHAYDFTERLGFTYTVLCADEDIIIGCVYIYPSTDDRYDADVRSWVRSDRAHLDAPLYVAVSQWFSHHWPFGRVRYDPR
jgi:hypothetical protein